MKYSTTILLLLAATVVVGDEAGPTDIAAPSTTIFIVRHAEKVAGQDDPGLTQRGHERAADLARLLKSSHVTECYCTQFKRTKLTAEPTAKAAGIEVQVHPAGDEAGLIKKILQEHVGKSVLITAHSSTVPVLLRHLGYKSKVEISEENYDNLFVVQTSPKQPRVLHLHYGEPDKRFSEVVEPVEVAK